MANKPRIRSWNHGGPLPSRGMVCYCCVWGRKVRMEGDIVLIICGPPQPLVNRWEVSSTLQQVYVHASFVWSCLFFQGRDRVCFIWARCSHQCACSSLLRTRSNYLYVLLARVAARSGCQNSVDDRANPLWYSHLHCWQTGSAEVERPSLQLPWAVP